MIRSDVRRMTSDRLRCAMMCVHVTLTFLGLLGLLVSTLPQEDKCRVAVSLLVFSLCFGTLIANLHSAWDLFLPAGMVATVCYLAYYIKGLLYIILSYYEDLNEAARYAVWCMSVRDVCRAFELSAAAFLAFTGGMAIYTFHAKRLDHRAGQKGSRLHIYRSDSLYLDRIARLFLLVGVCAAIVRPVAVWTFNLGASVGSPERIAGIPLLAGFMQLETMWGGRFFLAAAFAYNVVAGRVKSVIVVLVACLAFGLLSSLYTGSKGEMVIPFVIVGVVTALLWKWLPRFVKRVGVVGLLIFGLGYVYVYAGLHNYRYVKSDVTVSAYVKENTEKFGMAEGAYQILSRLTGIDGLASVVAYERECGHRPAVVLWRPAAAYVRVIHNFPDDQEIGLSSGIWGGLYLAGGTSLLLGGALLVGVASSFFSKALRPRMDCNNASGVLTIAFVATLSQLVVVHMMFCGLPAFDVKQMFCLLLSFFAARHWLYRTGLRYSAGCAPMHPSATGFRPTYKNGNLSYFPSCET